MFEVRGLKLDAGAAEELKTDLGRMDLCALRWTPTTEITSWLSAKGRLQDETTTLPGISKSLGSPNR